jgi:hypothetical protein
VAAGRGLGRWSRSGPPAAALALLLASGAATLRTPPHGGGPGAPTATGGARLVRAIPLERFKSTQALQPGVRIEGSLPGGAKFVGTVIDVGRDHVIVEMEPR